MKGQGGREGGILMAMPDEDRRRKDRGQTWEQTSQGGGEIRKRIMVKGMDINRLKTGDG